MDAGGRKSDKETFFFGRNEKKAGDEAIKSYIF